MKRIIEWWNEADDPGDGYSPPVTNGDIVLMCALIAAGIAMGIVFGVTK